MMYKNANNCSEVHPALLALIESVVIGYCFQNDNIACNCSGLFFAAALDPFLMKVPNFDVIFINVVVT